MRVPFWVGRGDPNGVWWIAKTGHRFPVAGLPVIRSRLEMASSCCRPSRWSLHIPDQSLVCNKRR